MSKDFLGPALTGLMVQDLMQTVVPWTLFEGRGAILERAFERAWGHEAPDGVGSLALPTSDLDGIQDRWFPRLLLNGTNDTTGQRMIAGTLPIRDANGHQVIVNALDQHAFLFPPDDGKPVPDLRLSTAAHNSARFPVVSPGGVLNNGGSAVVDGGYFENFGAATLVDLLDYLKERRRGPERPTRIIRPILIQISSDPDLGDQLGQDVPMETEIDGSLLKTGLKNRLWNLVGDPMGGVLSPRSARGVLAGQRLRLWAADIGFGDDRARIVEPLWLHFRMDKPSESVPGCKELAEVAAEPPLGWVLSQDSRDTIDHMINCVPHNADQMEKLVSAITATATPRQ